VPRLWGDAPNLTGQGELAQKAWLDLGALRIGGGGHTRSVVVGP
jgi:hypothetical protein